MVKRLVKYSAPSKFDEEPVGTIWEYHATQHQSSLYIKVEEKDKQRWIPIGVFLETALRPFLKEEDVVETLIALFMTSSEQYKQATVLSALIKKTSDANNNTRG